MHEPGDDGAGRAGENPGKLIRHLEAKVANPDLSCEGCRKEQERDGELPICEEPGCECPVPDLPGGAGRALSAWHQLNTLRDLPGAGMIIARHAALSAFEADLLVTIEATMKEGTRTAAPAAGEGE